VAFRFAQPDSERPAVNPDGTMSVQFRNWAKNVTDQGVIVGEGSPEGVVQALLTAQYMDSTGSTGSVLYIKLVNDILGDTTKGWILV